MFDNFFSMDNPLFWFLNKVADLAILSVLWLIFSIPIVTMGAASSALYYAMTKAYRNERGYVTVEFWNGFKKNLKQSTALWCIYLLVLAIFGADIWALKVFDIADSVGLVLYVFFLILILTATGVMIYMLAYTARFIQSVKGILRNSLILSVRHLPLTVLLVLLLMAGALGCYLFPFVVIGVPGVIAMVDSMLLEKVFYRYMSEEDRNRENMRNHPECYERIQNDTDETEVKK